MVENNDVKQNKKLTLTVAGLDHLEILVVAAADAHEFLRTLNDDNDWILIPSIDQGVYIFQKADIKSAVFRDTAAKTTMEAHLLGLIQQCLTSPSSHQ